MAGDNSDTRQRFLIETDELDARLDAPNLRIIDCNVLLTPRDSGGYVVESGIRDWEEAHIPNSIFVDMEKEVSADHPTLRFMLPTGKQFSAAMSARGIGDDSEVVVYSRMANFWATRLFMMFREFGFENVRVLNGAWEKWVGEGRSTSTEKKLYEPTTLTVSEPKGIFVGKGAVLTGVDDVNTCLLNALSPGLHSGAEVNPYYGRPGRIKNSVNLFAFKMVDKETNVFLDNESLRRKLDRAGALDADHVINYCGGGVSATTNAFAMLLLGKENFAIYDGSMLEWGNDDGLPMETG